MAALNTVSDYVASARVLLNDTAATYRYADSSLVIALSLAMTEARRLRPDLFIGRANAVPAFTVNDATVVVIDQQYRPAILFYIVGFAQLVDEEDTQDARAAGFMTMFRAQLLTLG